MTESSCQTNAVMFPSTLQRLAVRWYKHQRISTSRLRGRFLSRRKGGTALSAANNCQPAGHVCCALARLEWTGPGCSGVGHGDGPRSDRETDLTIPQMHHGDTWAEFAKFACQKFGSFRLACVQRRVNAASVGGSASGGVLDLENTPSLPSYVLLSLLLSSLAWIYSPRMHL